MSSEGFITPSFFASPKPDPDPRKESELRYNRIVAVLAAVTIATAACSSGHTVTYTAAPTPRPIGAGITVSGNRVPADLKATPINAVVPGSQVVGQMVKVTGGELRGDITLTFPLAAQTPTDGSVVVVTSESADGPWTIPDGQKVAADKHVVTVDTPHLSFWGTVKLDVGAAASEFKKNLIDGLTDFTTEAEPPKCQNESKTQTDGYVVTTVGGDALHKCFGIKKDKNGKDQDVLELVNRRRYPLLVSHPGFQVISAGRIKPDLDQLARIGSGSQSVIYPFEELDLVPTMEPGGSGTITTALDGWAQSLYQLEMGINTAASILTRFGAGGGVIANGAINTGKFDQIAKAMNTLLGSKDCFNAVHDVNPGSVLAKCFDPSELMEIFGWKGLILAPVTVAGSLVSYFISEFNSLGDQLNGRDVYTLTISRKASIQCLSSVTFASLAAQATSVGQAVVKTSITCDGIYAAAGRVTLQFADGTTEDQWMVMRYSADKWGLYENGTIPPLSACDLSRLREMPTTIRKAVGCPK